MAADRRCTQCGAANEADAAFCDQCAAPLREAPANAAAAAVAPSAAGEDGPAPCPACGGVVEDRGATGVCRDCGLELAAVETAPAAAASARPGLARALTQTILTRLGAGLPMEEAVAGALALHGIDDSDSDADGAESDGSEIAAPEQATAAPAGPQRAGACPVCRGAVAPGAGVCGGCGLSLRAEGKVHCPRCGETADAADEVCECGALLSLQALESRFDSTVRYVCARCKQLWQEYKTACPDCDGRLVGAEALRALFNRG